MKTIRLPDHYNYIGVFLTLRCNLNCDYCINKHGELAPVEELSTSGWIDGLRRIETRDDLPITLQGGEPTIHPGFYEIVNKVSKPMDLLTNGLFDIQEFTLGVMPERFRRGAKYAGIRFSFHRGTPPLPLALKVWYLQLMGYEVGIWGLDHPDKVNNRNYEMEQICKWLNIDFRMKEFLGNYEGKLYGTYKYKNAINQKEGKEVRCKPSELLINPAGYIFRCHADLYANRNYIGHILDEEIRFPDYETCYHYGQCNPCDVKLKTNRFQEFGHCSVTIKEKAVKIGEEVNKIVQEKGGE